MKNFLRKTLAMVYLFHLSLPVIADPATTTTLDQLRIENDQVIMELSQLMPYDVYTLDSPDRLVIEIPEVAYKAGFSKKEINQGLIRRVRGYQYKENPLISRIVIDLTNPVDYKTAADNNVVTISLQKNDLAATATKQKNQAKSSAPVVRKKDLLSSLPREEVTLDFEGADIRDVIRLMAETSNINMIFGPEVMGNVSIHLKRVPFDEAFSTILNLKGLVASQLGVNILRITTPEILQRERQKAIVFTKTIPINYLKAEEIQKHLTAVMASSGRKGTITVVNQTNSVVISDSEEGIGQAERLIAQLDRKPKQVMIEARIIEINLSNGFDIGVEWEFAEANRKGNKTRLLGTRTDIEENARLLLADGVVTQDESIGASLPSSGGTGVSLPGPTNAGITFGFVSADSILTATLAALITQSKAKILSSPKVVTVNGELAKIQAVQDIRFRTRTISQGTSAESIETVSAGIILEVTPTINAEDRITLKIKPESSFPTQETSGDIPVIRTRTAQTTVVIKDGETLVIGGLIDDQDTKGISKVPLLGDIPIIGAFFRSNTNRKTRNELLVFVTPRIVRD